MCLYFTFGILTLFLWKLTKRQVLKLRFLITLMNAKKQF